MHVPRVETSWVFRMCWGPIYVHLASFSIVVTSTIRGTFVSIQRVSWPIWSLQKTSPKLPVRCDGFRALFDLCELHSMSSFQTLHTKRLNYMDSTVSLITAALLFWIHVTGQHCTILSILHALRSLRRLHENMKQIASPKPQNTWPI